MILIECEQGSIEWLSARCGIPSASNFDQVLTSKGEPSKSSTKYAYKLAAERVSGIKEEVFQSAAMARGCEVEQEAVDFYELTQGVSVQAIGFCLHPSKRFGCSPDRLVGEEGLLEIKCPLSHTQVEYLLDNKLPTEYIAQVQGQLLVTGRKWCDFLSYFPGLRPLIIRVERDETYIAKLEAALITLCKEIDIIADKIR